MVVKLAFQDFCATSDHRLANSRWVRRSQAELEKAQSSLSLKKRGSKNRRQERDAVVSKHRENANQRRNFHHKTARALVTDYDLIAVEGLKIKKTWPGEPKLLLILTQPAAAIVNDRRQRAGQKHLRRVLGDLRQHPQDQSGRSRGASG